MKITQKTIDELSYSIIGCAIEVHRELGPGLLENIYEHCFLRELSSRGIDDTAQQKIPIFYKGSPVEAELRYDVLVENKIVVELKSNEAILPIHEAVLLTYMKLLEKPKGILINFNCTNIFKQGQRAFVNEHYTALPKY